MRTLTIATASAGYFPLLLASADRFDYALDVLGWGKPWHGTSKKLDWYRDALNRCDPAEIVAVVDGYDTVFSGPAAEAERHFIETGLPYLFSGQRYFPSNRPMRRLADRVMGIGEGAFRRQLESERYGRPCMGGLIGHAGPLVELFSKLIEIEARERSGHDQIPLNRYFATHPDEAHVDRECRIFQSLWRTKGRFPRRGCIDPHDDDAEVRVVDHGRIENRFTGTQPQILHGPMDLDLNPLLEEMGLDVAEIHRVSGAKYFRDSIRSYLKIFFQQELALLRRRLPRGSET